MLNAVFLDKHGVLYKPMSEQLVRLLTWHGLPILELAPKATPLKSKGVESSGGEENVNFASNIKFIEFEGDTFSYRVSTKPTS